MLFQKEETFTFAEAKEYFKVKEIKEMRTSKEQLEQVAKVIIQNPKLKKLTVFLLGNMMMLEALARKASAEVPEGVVKAGERVDETGYMFLFLIRKLGYWICIIMCVVEILRCIGEGDLKRIGNIVLKYIIIFGTLYALPMIFDLIKQTLL